MVITRFNHFVAKPSKEDAMAKFLDSIAPLIRRSEGNISCTVLRALDNKATFTIVEQWESIDAHRQSAKLIPPALFAQAQELLAAMPTGEYWEEQE